MASVKEFILRSASIPSDRLYRIDYESALNPAQLEAVTTLRGPLLVVAGAGTGKTRTLVYRVARLVEHGVPPQQILLLTFTRKAAEEMLQRAAFLLDGRCRAVQGGTFHAFGNAVLREYGNVIGLSPHFTILDQGDMEDVIQRVRSELGLDRSKVRFPRKQAIAEVISMSVNKEQPISLTLQELYPHFLEHAEAIERVARLYQQYKRERQLVDYDDLLVLLRELLRGHAAIRRALADRYRFVMVDEYQDTNRLQADIVWLLGQEHGNVMVVGDDAQSIYSFRGANYRNILDFPQRFPDARVVTIEQNYRSTQPILDLANAVLARASEGYGKQLFSAQREGEPPFLVALPDERTQSQFVCQQILELREQGYRLQDIAVLMRSGFHSFDLEMELAQHRIPFVKRGGYRLVEAAHVKDVLAHLRLAVNPFDAISWHRVLLLIDGIGPRTAVAIEDWIQRHPEPVGALQSFPRTEVRQRLVALATLLDRLDRLSAPEAQADEVLRYYEPLLQRHYPEDHPRRRRDLEHLVGLAAQHRSLAAFLTRMALDPPTDAVDGVMAAERDDELLVLSTIHSAKGLEWRAVFLIWATEGRFPSALCLRPNELEEERRLLYVAVTRAKERLYITYPIQVFDRSRGLTFGKVSRFLEDIPEHVLVPARVVFTDSTPA
ncbi:MAG: ATP-dependent helicase [Candidatus Binatia bacterium]|nr:ATP-dependent helicase [Candidatus Binatia bacterium]